MDNTHNSGPGLLGSARLVLSALLEIGHNRLQLASTELEEERLRVAELMLLATIALFFLSMAAVFSSLLVVVWFWDTHRVLALAGVTAAHLGIGVCAAWVWRRRARSKPPLLAATLQELRRDHAALRQAARGATASNADDAPAGRR